MQYDYFVASRWRNKDEVLRLVHGLRDKGKSVYCFLDAPHQSMYRLQEDPEKAMQVFESLDWKTDKYIKEVFEKDMDAERNANNFILLLPAGKSAHVEAGAAYGFGKHLILVGEQKEAESLYLIFDEHYSTIDAFLASLS